MPKELPPPVDPELALPRIEAFLRGALESSGLKCFVLGLSGGVDSALAAALAERAVGSEAVFALKMPHRESSPASERDAELVASFLGIRAKRVDITPVVDSYFGEMGEASPLRRGNFMARARMACLFDISMREHGLVLGTSNRTETLLGYGTWYGDMACSVNPIGGLFKTHVWQLSRHLGLPEAVVAKAPSADLWPDQTDEGEMGIRYAQADAILHLFVDKLQTDEEVVALGYGAELVGRVKSMMSKSEFKRHLPRVADLSGCFV